MGHGRSDAKSSGLEIQIGAFKNIEAGLLGIALEQEFRDSVHRMVGREFDDDTEVLIKDICAIEFADTEINDALDDIERELTKFEGVDGGRTYHPQIFIPFYRALQAAELLGTGNVVTAVNFSTQADVSGTLIGKVLNAQHELEVIPAIDEEFASTREVWVLSINERVKDDGTLIDDRSTKAAGPLLNVRINQIAIKTNHESWFAGASESHIRAFRTYADGLDPSTGNEVELGSEVNSTHPQGSQIKKIARNDTWVHFDVDFNLVLDWEFEHFEEDPVVMGYSIFEYDPWPTSTRTCVITLPNGDTRSIEYRSKDLNYVKGRWMSNTNNGQALPYVVGWHFDNWEIELDIEQH